MGKTEVLEMREKKRHIEKIKGTIRKECEKDDREEMRERRHKDKNDKCCYIKLGAK